MKLLLFLLMIVSTSAFGYTGTSPHVSLDDRAYHQLDQLVGHGLIDSVIVGQRPYSRQEVVRLTVEAKRAFEAKKETLSPKSKEVIENILQELAERFSVQATQIKPLEWVGASTTYLNSEAKIFPTNNSAGIIDATVNPLVQNRQGRNYVDGGQYSFETAHSIQSKYASFYVQPRFEFLFPDGAAAPTEKALIQELYATFGIANLNLEIGRSTLILGQGKRGGILLSDNPRPLDHLKLSNDHPVILPWIFKYLGENKLTLFFGTLGPESFFEDTILAGYKWSMKPFSVWELGISNIMHIGGEGAPDFGAEDFIGDFFGFSGTSNSTSNRILGLDTRVRLPFLRNTQIYLEFFLDDKTLESFRRTFVDTAAYYGGISVPRLNSSGTLYGQIEFRYLSEIFYRHGQFRSGHTLNQDLLGDPLGPDGRSIAIDLGWDLNPKFTFTAHAAFETSDSNTYFLTGTSSTVLVDNPAEKRVRLVLGADHRCQKRVELQTQFGYERVMDFAYVSGDDRNNFLGEIGMKIHFEDLFQN